MHAVGTLYFGQDDFVQEVTVHHLAFSTDLRVRSLPAACVYSDATPDASFLDCMAAVQGECNGIGRWFGAWDGRYKRARSSAATQGNLPSWQRLPPPLTSPAGAGAEDVTGEPPRCNVVMPFCSRGD